MITDADVRHSATSSSRHEQVHHIERSSWSSTTFKNFMPYR